MAQPPPHRETPSPDDMHWGISYLREDLQDVRQDIRALHVRVDSLHSRIDSRFALLLTAMIALTGVTVGTIIAFLQFHFAGN